jgi:UPF0755 protein
MSVIKVFNERKFPIALGAIAFSMLLLATFLTYLKNPADHADIPVKVEIPKGANLTAVVSILSDAGLIKHKTLFHILAGLKNVENRIRAGEYELSTSMTPAHILDKIVRGEVVEYKIVIPEGCNLIEIADRLEEDNLIKREVFLNLTADRKFLASLGIDASTAEGYLFPDTYKFTRHTGEKEIIRLMVQRLHAMATSEMRERAESLGLTFTQFVTLASMIEKEALLKNERALISAVFHNRLRIGMKLQSDPTSVYGMENFNGPIKRSHLKRISPYNTYVIHGLPPGPISSPGIDSMIAALYPAPVDYLYFVSRKDGSHQFSSNLRSHNQAAARYITKKD